MAFSFATSNASPCSSGTKLNPNYNLHFDFLIQTRFQGFVGTLRASFSK